MRSDFNVLAQHLAPESGFDELLEAFVGGEYDGIYIRVPQGVELSNIDFIARLPGLRYVEVNGAVRDDSQAFLLPGVEEIVLLTSSRTAAPAVESNSLVSLGLDDRPGFPDLSACARLQSLTIWSFARTDLQILSNAPNLQRFKVEGEGQVVDLEGMEGCRSLRDIELLEVRTESLAPLRSLQDVVRFWLIGPAEPEASASLNLDDLTHMRSLRELRITNSGSVLSVESLLRLPELRDIRLRGTAVSERSAEVLELLSRTARVVGPDA